MCTNRWIDAPEYTYNGIPLGNKKKETTDRHSVDKSQSNQAEWKKPDLKWASIYIQL